MSAKKELGTIIVRIYRVRVTGPWQGKLSRVTPTAETKPILVGEKHPSIEVDHRVGYFALDWS